MLLGLLYSVLICQHLEPVVQPITDLLLEGKGEEASHWSEAQPKTNFCAATGRQ